MNPTDSSFEFEPIDAPFGAFVHGLSPDGLGNRDVDRLQAGLLEHGLLVFRGRAIEAAELVAIGRAFGELEILPEPDKRHPVHPEIFDLTNVRPDGRLVAFDEPQSVDQGWFTIAGLLRGGR